MSYNCWFYQNAERHDDAVKAMEEVVAIDEQTGHQDLESDVKGWNFRVLVHARRT